MAQSVMDDAAELARIHDELLFVCAYPPSPQALRRAESALKDFSMGEIDPLLDPEISGIAGTAVDTVFSYDFVKWLQKRFPRQVDIDWEEPPDPERISAVLEPSMPLLRDLIVDNNVPYFEILRRLGGLPWLLHHVDGFAYDALGLWIRWDFDARHSRTLMRRKPRTIFYQQGPMLTRRDVSIARELGGPPLPVKRLSRAEGEKALELARTAVAVRYREVINYTYADPSTVIVADAGRGVEIILFGLPPERRLPLRAGFGPFVLRNGVPIGYGDAYGLCERMDVSFNIFQAFRKGESAFCFARLLKLYHQLFGSTVFSIDPYQIGEGNEEAIASGAFWFYRKLGFRSTDSGVERMARREEALMAKEPAHRTSAPMLRKMARSPLIYETNPTGEWDRFNLRNIVLKTNDIRDLIDDRQILRAKKGRSEERYLRLLARNQGARRALLKAGTASG